MRKGSLFVAIAIVGILIASGVYYLAEVYADSTGVGYDSHGARGNSADNDAWDLLDSDSYVTSWDKGGESEKIVLQGGFYIYWDIPASTEVKRVQYRVLIEGSGTGVLINGVLTTSWQSEWITQASDVWLPDADWYTSKAIIITLTNPFIGKITATYWADQQWDFGTNSGINLLSKDEAYLKSGIGSVKVTNDVVEEGEKVSFTVTTGYATTSDINVLPSEQGWTLLVANPDGDTVWSTKIADSKTNYVVYWEIPIGSYSPTSRNTFSVSLRNELINQDDDWFFTVGVGMIGQIPPKPEFELLEGSEPFAKGESVTVRLSAEENPLGYTISGFWVWVSTETSAATTVDYIYIQKFYSAFKQADGVYTADVNWVMPDTGDVRMEVSTVDIMNLNSGIAEMHFDVQDINQFDDDTSESDWLTLVIGIVAIALGILMLVLCFMYVPQPYGVIIGAVVMIILAAIGAYYILQFIGT